MQLIFPAGLACAMLCGTFAATNAAAQAHATLESASYPRTMEAGRRYPVKVTLLNSGNVTWTNGDPADGTMFRLSTPASHFMFGLNRVNLSKPTVAPGERHTFSFYLTAPAIASGVQEQAPFTWQMVHERRAPFGQPTPAVFKDQMIEVAYAPPLAASRWPTIAPSVRPLVAADSDFTFGNFRGANVVNVRYAANGNKHTDWFHSEDETIALLDEAKQMNLNVLRLPVVIPPATAAFVPAEWGTANPRAAISEVVRKTRFFLREAAKRQMKVMVTLDGYTKYGYDGENKNCYWKKSFVDVAAHAEILVAALANEPGLYAYDLLNEPLHNASQRWHGGPSCLESALGVTDVDAYKSVVNAVHAMYNLIKRYDRTHLTTVGEGNIAWMKYWSDVSSFLSYHLYYDNAAITPAQWAADAAIQRGILSATIQSIRSSSTHQDRPWPVVISEYGHMYKGSASMAAPNNQINWYRNNLLGLKQADAGGALWALSKRDQFRITGHGDVVDAQLKCVIKGMQHSDNPPLDCAL